MKKKNNEKFEINGVEIDNVNEFQNQHKENMIKSGHYARLELIVANDDEFPYEQLDLHSCSGIDVMRLYALMKSAVKQFEHDYPMECAMSKIFIGMEHLGSYNEEIDNKGED